MVVLAIRQRRRRCGGCHHHHAFIVVDGGCSNRCTRADGADHIADLAVDHAVGGHGALLGLASVIHGHQFDLLATNTASRIGHFDSGGCAFFDHVAVLSQSAGGGDDQGDLDLGVCSRGYQSGTSQTQSGNNGLHAERNAHEDFLRN